MFTGAPVRGANPVVLFVVTVLWAWLRVPEAARDTLWAEDGRDFLADSAAASVGSLWATPYAGYLHLLPRVIADAVTASVDVEHWALAMTAASCLTVGVVAVVVWACTADLVTSPSARGALALTPVLLPVVSVEVLGNVANLHWFLLWVAPWVLLHRPRTHVGVVLATVGLFVVGATEIQAVLFVPLLLWGWRDARRWPARVALLAGLVAQAVAAVSSPREEMAGAPGSLADLVTGYLVNVPGGALWADASSVGEIADGRLWLLALAALPFVAAGAWVLLRGTALQRVAAVTLLGGSVGAYAGAYLANGYHRAFYSTWGPAEWEAFSFSRYGVVPGMLLVALLPLALGVALGRRRRFAAVVLGLLLAVVTLVQVVQTGSTDGPRAAGPEWTGGADAVVEQCETGQAEAVAPIAPGGPWTITLPCSYVEAHE